MSSGLVFETGAELGIAQAADVQASWLQTLAELDTETPTHPPTLDLSTVQEIDSAGVQLLLALRRALTERGLTLQLGEPSAVVREALARLGLDEPPQPEQP